MPLSRHGHPPSLLPSLLLLASMADSKLMEALEVQLRRGRADVARPHATTSPPYASHTRATLNACTPNSATDTPAAVCVHAVSIPAVDCAPATACILAVLSTTCVTFGSTKLYDDVVSGAVPRVITDAIASCRIWHGSVTIVSSPSSSRASRSSSW